MAGRSKPAVRQSKLQSLFRRTATGMSRTSCRNQSTQMIELASPKRRAIRLLYRFGLQVDEYSRGNFRSSMIATRSSDRNSAARSGAGMTSLVAFSRFLSPLLFVGLKSECEPSRVIRTMQQTSGSFGVRQPMLLSHVKPMTCVWHPDLQDVPFEGTVHRQRIQAVWQRR